LGLGKDGRAFLGGGGRDTGVSEVVGVLKGVIGVWVGGEWGQGDGVRLALFNFVVAKPSSLISKAVHQLVNEVGVEKSSMGGEVGDLSILFCEGRQTICQITEGTWARRWWHEADGVARVTGEVGRLLQVRTGRVRK
jgi:hypothetical protein